MAYVYDDVEDLVTNPPQPLVGTGHCVPLVRHYANCPETEKWSEGKMVKGNDTIAKGTAIATFVKGKYPNNVTGNHAALYLSQDNKGLWVVDQYKTSGGIKKRQLRHKGMTPTGEYVDPSNNGDAFSVII